MRIGYFADGEWAHRALAKIMENNKFQVVFIVPRYNSIDNTLKQIAEKEDIAYLIAKDVNNIEFIDKINDYKPDILVSMSFDQIMKKQIINLTNKGFINCHAGSLPFYRGRNVLNWVLINGENSFGITVHYVDEGIDTGDIILQKHININTDDNYSTLLNKAYYGCADTLVEALTLILKGEATRTKQSSIHPVGFYCSKRIDGDEWINWQWSSNRIHNFVRALSPPGPGARTVLNNKTVAILKTKLIEKAPNYINTIGEVVGKDNEGVIVKTGDNSLKIFQVATFESNGSLIEKKVPNYRIGTRFGSQYF